MKARAAGLCCVAAAGMVLTMFGGQISVAPAPVEISTDWSVRVPLDGKVTVRCAEATDDGARWIGEKFAAWFGRRPQVTDEPSAGEVAEEEGYRIDADADGIRIAARTMQGVRYAAYTIRQLAIPRRGTLKTDGFILPRTTVRDAPAITRRFLHLCWLPEYSTDEMERRIRLAATLKFNYIILESWGVFRSERHPWWGWQDGKMTPAEVRRLVALGRDLGVTLAPQLNVFGHAAMSRIKSGKHAVLDFQDEYAPLFEPNGGWNWCLSNPEARRILKDLVREEWEAFGRPPFIHIGFDEAHEPSCPDCMARPYHELVGEHLRDMCAFVRELGARPMVWDDMFFAKGVKEDAALGLWGNGTPETKALVSTLPKDVIFCPWDYKERKGKFSDYPKLTYFQTNGFDVVAAPCYVAASCAAQGRIVRERKLFGYMGTSWIYCFGGLYADVFTYNAFAAWGAEVGDYERDSKISFMRVLRDVTHDVPGLAKRQDTGVFNEQTKSVTSAVFGWRGSAYRNWFDPPEKK